MSLLHSFLRRHDRIALDTNVFIYSFETHPKYVVSAREVLAWVEHPGHSAITSTVTLTELLVKPYQSLEERVVRRMKSFLISYPNLEWVPADIEIADLAGRLRAEHGLKTPDAILAATTIQSAATGLVTNDVVFKRVPQFETLVIEESL